MAWEVHVRPPVQPTLPTLHSGEELIADNEEPPKLYRSPSSLDRMLTRIGSEIIHARSIMRPWRYFWGQRHGEVHNSDDEEDLVSREPVRREGRASSRRGRECTISEAVMLSVVVLTGTLFFVAITGADWHLAMPSVLGLAFLSIGLLVRRCAGYG